MVTKPGSHKRGLRRAALARKKRKARIIYPHDHKARSANHLAACSCHMCGNPRRHWNKDTMQERCASIDATQQITEAI